MLTEILLRMTKRRAIPKRMIMKFILGKVTMMVTL